MTRLSSGLVLSIALAAPMPVRAATVGGAVRDAAPPLDLLAEGRRCEFNSGE
jgi:hypothetical protein